DNLINGLGGMQTPPHIYGAGLKPGKTQDALQLVVQYDHVGFDYAAADGSTAAVDKLVGSYGLNTIGVGVNYWYTKHIRLTANFLYNTFSGVAAHPLGTSENSYELTFRAALAL